MTFTCYVVNLSYIRLSCACIWLPCCHFVPFCFVNKIVLHKCLIAVSCVLCWLCCWGHNVVFKVLSIAKSKHGLVFKYCLIKNHLDAEMVPLCLNLSLFHQVEHKCSLTVSVRQYYNVEFFQFLWQSPNSRLLRNLDLSKVIQHSVS